MPSADNQRLATVQPGLFQPYSVLPSQYFGSLTNLTPEHRLMIAILQEAIDCVRKHRNARDVRGRRLLAETTCWLLTEQTVWPFSFESICAVLDLDANAVRSVLRLAEQPPGLVSAVAKTTSATLADSLQADAGVQDNDAQQSDIVSTSLRRCVAATATRPPSKASVRDVLRRSTRNQGPADPPSA